MLSTYYKIVLCAMETSSFNAKVPSPAMPVTYDLDDSLVKELIYVSKA
ncbi:MAG: hypothetical protein RAP03_12945 [Candidatus Electryonea clarkiae]|nr:hypothetical protein [Candidatus Electryonea clarkiae]